MLIKFQKQDKGKKKKYSMQKVKHILKREHGQKSLVLSAAHLFEGVV